MGATVLAVPRPGQKNGKLCTFALQTSGTLVAPVLGADADTEVTSADDEIVSRMGADLLSLPRTLSSWILAFCKPSTRCVVGTYVYLDSERHVRATMATDVIAKTLCEARKSTVLSYLGSPATVHTIPPSAYRDSIEAYKGEKYSKWWHGTASFFLGLGGYRRNAREPIKRGDDSIHVFNGLLVAQGPNYAVAKHLQMWRCLVASADGHKVTTPMTPPATTDSVMHSSTMAVAMKGLSAFPPMRPFSPSTVSPLMAIVSVAMLIRPESKRTSTSIDHPYQIFEQSAFHGGNWRIGYRQEDLGSAIYLAGMLS